MLFCSLCVARTDLQGMASRVSSEVRLCVLVLYADDSRVWLYALHLEWLGMGPTALSVRVCGSSLQRGFCGSGVLRYGVHFVSSLRVVDAVTGVGVE